MDEFVFTLSQRSEPAMFIPITADTCGAYNPTDTPATHAFLVVHVRMIYALCGITANHRLLVLGLYAERVCVAPFFWTSVIFWTVVRRLSPSVTGNRHAKTVFPTVMNVWY